MYYLGNSTVVESLYIASTDYMYATIMCLDDYLDYPNTAALQLFAERLTPDCKAFIKNLVYKFMSRLDKSRNSLIIAVLGTDIIWKSRTRRQWVKSLYIHTDLV